MLGVSMALGAGSFKVPLQKVPVAHKAEEQVPRQFNNKHGHVVQSYINHVQPLTRRGQNYIGPLFFGSNY